MNLPNFLTLNSINNTTSILTGTPRYDNVGENIIKLQAKDLSNGITIQEFVIRVFNINDVSTFTSVPITDAFEDSEYIYTIKISDEDLSGNIDLSENITFTALTLPEFLKLISIDNKTARLIGTPLQNNVGENFVEIKVEDSSGAFATQQFIINVANVEDEATGTLSFTGDVKEGATLTADTSDIKDVDTNNEPLTFTFQWQLADDSSSFDSNSNLSGAISNKFTIPSDQSYVDKYIRLTAISKDDRGGTTLFESSSQLIANVEDEAAGTVNRWYCTRRFYINC